ncbi:hypothetical protein L1049_006541 [Liquidambar formosana]|uniref:BAG domain-containing protein n=1 Tax=Liquidambar formosana TaxID=63359 RepID=A0AAP0RFR2_LIQFO
MDSPYFRSNWNSTSRPRPRHSPSVRGIPVPRQTTSSPKVVSIPVRFVESGRTRSAAATKIQKVFRGFLVRKSVKRILAIRREVEEIELRISREETVDLIRREPKERLKLNETLMALLFKLDSVRGVDSGVRDCRKAVIRRAIALQEKVDAIVAGDQTLGEADGTNTEVQASEVDDRGDFTGNSDLLDGTVDQNLEIRDSMECSVDETLESKRNPSDVKDSASPSDCDGLGNAVDRTLGLRDPVESVLQSDESELIAEASDETLKMQISNDSDKEATSETLKLQVPNVYVDEPDRTWEKMESAQVGVDSEIKENEVLYIPTEIVENHNTAAPSVSECVEESVETSQMESQSATYVNSESLSEGGEENISVKPDNEMGSSPPERTSGERDDNRRNRELLERMMEDNEKLMGMMTELSERNAMQSRLLSSLSQRVELLERAFLCERLRRKKKRHVAGTVDCQETSPDPKKCGKRV